MKVKINNGLYDSDDTPILIILTKEEQKGLTSLFIDSNANKFVFHNKKINDEIVEEIMKTKIINSIEVEIE